MLKKLLFSLYMLIVACIGITTIIEKYYGTSFVSDHVYGSWWFVALWGALTIVACYYMFEQKLYKRFAVFFLHMAFVLILVGALTTFLTAKRGNVHLRKDLPTTTYTDKENYVQPLTFSLSLKDFNITNYPGTDAPLDYQSIIEVNIEGKKENIIVSMNNIGSVGGYRLFQSSYDSDNEGVTLGVSYDPYGIAITYAGYLCLLIGIIATLLSRKTQMRSLYRKAIKPTAVIALLMTCMNIGANDNLPTVDKDIAHRLGEIHILYNNRICPMNTVATDFVTKLSGSPSWHGYSADEIFTSWMIYYSPWEQQKIIRVKSKEVQQLLGIDSQWASYSDFVDDYNEYKLKTAINDVRTGKAHYSLKGLMEADEKFHIIDMFYRGELLHIFPHKLDNGTVKWFSPGSQALPREIPVKEQFFIKQSMDFLTESIVTGQKDKAMEIAAKIELFQHDMIGSLLPGKNETRAEILYNTLGATKWPVFMILTISLLLCIALSSSIKICESRWFKAGIMAYAAIIIGYITLQLALRWWLSGHIPVSNGHETMLFMAWAILLIAAFTARKITIVMGYGLLIASFCLLVAILSGSSSQITPLMPVLQSPLLSVHVMTVMCAYALFALQCLLGIQSIIMIKRNSNAMDIERLTALSKLLQYPAVFLLALGIFIGALWANVSWGNYWSWDPKETWALITLMIYGIGFHDRSIKWLQKPIFYHVYITLSFLTILMTYFGVNYFLGGMHSYA